MVANTEVISIAAYKPRMCIGGRRYRAIGVGAHVNGGHHFDDQCQYEHRIDNHRHDLVRTSVSLDAATVTRQAIVNRIR